MNEKDLTSVSSGTTFVLDENAKEELAGAVVSGNEDIETLNEYDVASKKTARISEVERAKIIPENIAQGITVLGVEGTHSSGITPSGNIEITTTNQVDVTDYATAQVVDGQLLSENIKANTSILGVNGNFYGMVPENDMSWGSGEYYYCNMNAERGSSGYVFNAGSLNLDDIQVYFTIPDAAANYLLNPIALNFGSIYEFADNGSDSPFTSFSGIVIPESIAETKGLYTYGSSEPVDYAFYDSNNDPINLMNLQSLELNTETQITDMDGTQYIIKRIEA